MANPFRNRKGQFTYKSGSQPPIADYRARLLRMEPMALKIIEQALKSKDVSMRDKIMLASEILTRLHGKTMVGSEVEETRRKLESLSMDELKARITELAAEMGSVRSAH